MPIGQYHKNYEDGTFKYFNYRSTVGQFLLTDGTITNTNGDIITLENESNIWGRNTLTCKDEIIKYITADYQTEGPLDIPTYEIKIATDFMHQYGVYKNK